MNIKYGILGLVVGLSAVSLGACQNTPEKAEKDMAAEQKAAQEKIDKAEKEAAEKTAKAKKEADEKMANAAKDLEQKKADVNKDLAEELADIKYNSFVALADYKVLVTKRLAEQEKRLAEIKLKGEGKAASMSADAKKEWTEAMNTTEKDLKQARDDVKSLDTVAEPAWSATKTKVDNSLKSFKKSVDALEAKVNKY